ncbi:histidine kinase sensor protein [Geminocystis sp. NIES-3709]|nr:histidine kinase sensor protein [Geminocystis sp. NIES-3709]
MGRDITHRKSIETQLSHTRTLFDRINEVGDIGLWDADLINNKIYWSKITKKIHEVSEDYIADLDTAINFIKEGENRDKLVSAMDLAIREGIGYDLEVVIITATKKEIWVRIIGNVKLENGKCVEFFGTIQDITTRKKTEIELLKTKEFLDQTNQLARVGGWQMYLNAEKVEWSNMTRIIHELPSPSEVTLMEGINFYKEGKSRNTVINAVNDAINLGKSSSLEVQFITAKAREIWVKLIIKSEFKDGKCIRIYGSFQDIDRQKRNQIALLEKTAEYNELAGLKLKILNYESQIVINQRFYIDR